MKKLLNIFLILLIIIAIILVYNVLYILNFIPRKVYTAGDFNIDVIKSETDYDNDGIDDYTDILLGARKDAVNHPQYVADSYTIGGYPDDNIGVCTDVVWRAFKEAGYILKDLVDDDISKNVSLYPAVNGKPDPNIDFRRVRNLKVFFDRYALVLTNDIENIEEFQPGDIVIFGDSYKHIGIISDKRNKKGIPYLIHNSGQPVREEDALEFWNNINSITGHYRWKK